MPESQQLATRKVAIFGVILGLLVFSLWMAFPNKLECSADGPAHSFGVWFYQNSLKDYLRVPWTNPNQSAGSLFSVFYSSLFYTASAIFSFVMSYIYSIKLVIALSYLLSIYAMYLLAREYGLDEAESLMAGIIFSFSNWFLVSTFFRGAYLDLVGRAFLPLSLLYLKRGLRREFFPFVIATAVMLASNQSTAFFLMPAIFIYGAINNRQDTRRLLLSFFLLAIFLLFYAVPYSYTQGETYYFSLGKSPFTLPTTLIMPQWGLRYGAYDSFLITGSSLDSAYVGVFHAFLAIVGAAFFWRRPPDLSALSIYSLVLNAGPFQEILPIRLTARYLFLLSVPLAIFAVHGIRKLGESRMNLPLIAFVTLLWNSAGLVLMLHVYASRAGLSVNLLLPAMALLAFSASATLAHKTGKLGYCGLVMLLLAFEVLPNAFNPTMVLPGPSQIDPCQYPTGGHEFLANNFCAPNCDGVYVYQPGHSFTGSKTLMTRYETESVGSSRCPESLSRLGIKYCFERGRPFEFNNTAKFIDSTSNFTIVEDSPDRVSIDFAGPGKTTLRLGFFSEYRAYLTGGERIALRESADGFIEFDNPAGQVDMAFFPPLRFLAAYALSLALGLACLAKLPRKKEYLAVVLPLLLLLLHVGIRLADMVSLYLR